MVNMLHRIQSPLTNMPSRPTGGRRPVPQFGALSRDQILPYQDVLNKLGEKQYKPNNLVAVHDEFLTERAKDRLEEIHNQLGSPGKFKSLYKKGDLGPTGFASDMIFELYTMVALRENVVPQKFIKELAEKNMLPAKVEDRIGKDFPQFLHDVEVELDKHDKKLPESKIKFFQNLVGGDPKQAKRMLNLIAARLLLQQVQVPKVSGLDDAKDGLRSAMTHFNGHFPWYSPRRLQTWLMTEAYSHLSFLSVEWFRCQLLSIVRGRVVKDLKYEDMIKNLEENQVRRQEVAYFHPELDRGAIAWKLRGMELMNEAVIVENAVLGHYR